MAEAEGKGVQAFILVEAKAGTTLEVSRETSKVDGVIASYAVTGPFDVIVHAEAADIKSLAQIVVAKIQALDSVVRTLTCIVLESSRGK